MREFETTYLSVGKVSASNEVSPLNISRHESFPWIFETQELLVRRDCKPRFGTPLLNESLIGQIPKLDLPIIPVGQELPALVEQLDLENLTAIDRPSTI